ncbi:adenylosuccinate lyase [Mycoplasma sp. Mirounga ES2805-ORL]|uniref:adenylosuccinate lyase n=1 Tax=Mycoplasma sp. Mirounga ES2805-ORL TaxID=754514 RepID=UPI00197C927A|nr:adenylosuccinate lyase [Mycoplasma sp. Mirounga ES2805-ORL]QSF13464.1 adenylosuccinate lyase [Mycoplasma sp. Mirounga ES2805-ORL]
MNIYENPLCTRYASKKMKYIFSPEFKFKSWRKMWLYLAESQKELGLSFITQDQIDDLKKHLSKIDFDTARKLEKEFKHDVMAHINAFGMDAQLAKPIIHLGATSAYVGDNTDLIQIKEGLLLIKQRLLNVINELAIFSNKYKDIPCLGYTHFQPAQLTTVGKRATLWLQSFMFDLEDIENKIINLKFRGVKGTTGTQASFKELFKGSYKKVRQLDELVSKKAGFKKRQLVSGQTYDRKQDTFILQTLANIAASSAKITNDLRLLQHLNEFEEPFGQKQIGSSAMAYKKNPIKCERVSALSKFVISNELNGHLVSSSQWFERTLDDSANKRLSYPQCFLAVDSILVLLNKIIKDGTIYPKIISKNLEKELPFIATENIIMRAVEKGMDRQKVHEIIRELSMVEIKKIKMEGKENNLIHSIIQDGRLKIIEEDLKDISNPENYIGFSIQQVDDFLNEVNRIILKNKKYIISEDEEINV